MTCKVTIEFIERPLNGVAESIKHFRFLTLQYDTYSQKRNKGEMGTVVTLENGKVISAITGWSKWTYSKDEPVISCRRKADYIVNNMEKMGIIPTDLTNDEISNHIVIVYVSGDGLYDGIIEYINDSLKQKYNNDNIRIWECLSGPTHIDDGHKNLNACDAAKKSDKEMKQNFSLITSVTNFLRGCKGSSVVRDVLGESITFGQAPDHRMVPHLSTMIDPLLDNYRDVIQTLRICKWSKTEGALSFEFVLELLLGRDLQNVISQSIYLFQRIQQYRCLVELVDRHEHERIGQYKSDLILFENMVKRYAESRDKNEIRRYLDRSNSFESLKTVLIDMINIGMYDGILLNWQKNPLEMTKLKWLKRDCEDSDTVDMNELLIEVNNISFEWQNEECKSEIIIRHCEMFDSSELVDVDIASDSEFYRSMKALQFIHRKFRFILRYCVELFEKRRNRMEYTISEDGAWGEVYYPHIVENCMTSGRHTTVYGNIEFEKIYDTNKVNNEFYPTHIFFNQSAMKMKENFIRFKTFIRAYMDNSETNFKHTLRNAYATGNSEVIQDCLLNIYQIAKSKLYSQIPSFFVFWEIKQSQFQSTLGVVEGAGSVIQLCGKTKAGRPKGHEEIEKSTLICSQLGGISGTVTNNICGGVTHIMVDNSSSAVKSKAKHNVSRQKYPDKGKTILRIHKRKTKKFNVPIILNATEIRGITIKASSERTKNDSDHECESDSTSYSSDEDIKINSMRNNNTENDSMKTKEKSGTHCNDNSGNNSDTRSIFSFFSTNTNIMNDSIAGMNNGNTNDESKNQVSDDGLDDSDIDLPSISLVTIGNETIGFEKDRLRSISYFGALLSERWQSRQNSSSIILFGNDQIGTPFTMNDFQNFLICLEDGKMPLSMACNSNTIDRLVECDEYLMSGEEQLINQNMFIEYFQNISLDVNDARRLITNTSKALVRQAAIQYIHRNF